MLVVWGEMTLTPSFQFVKHAYLLLKFDALLVFWVLCFFLFRCAEALRINTKQMEVAIRISVVKSTEMKTKIHSGITNEHVYKHAHTYIHMVYGWAIFFLFVYYRISAVICAFATLQSLADHLFAEPWKLEIAHQ